MINIFQIKIKYLEEICAETAVNIMIFYQKKSQNEIAKDNYKIPFNTHKLHQQLNTWQGLLQLVFGPNALIAKEAGRWVHHIDHLETTYDKQFKIDRDFGAKVCGLIDRLTWFLPKCFQTRGCRLGFTSSRKQAF
jgi:hypothetical protein